MAKNKVQCQKGLSINAFMAKYGTEGNPPIFWSTQK